ncbi:ATP-binding protein [Sphingomonas oryzagri]
MLLPIYMAAFVLLHHASALWGVGVFYSLWFPGAGLRFAMLWRLGPKWTPVLALAELVSQLAVGEVVVRGAPLPQLVGIVGPCLVYGLVIFVVKERAERRTSTLRLAPLPFVLAALLAPMVACVAALPWAIPSAAIQGPVDGRAVASALLVFALGDMLGVLVVAPPLLRLVAWFEGQREWDFVRPGPLLAAELIAVTVAAWGAFAVTRWTGLAVLPAPVLLSTCWVGLRSGRQGAWISILIAAAVILPMTAGTSDPVRRLDLHMLLAGIAAVGYLAGSFAEAEARSQAEIARRDRMLYQAERLKTLRAMSIAVIHEISQPLSTIGIEANHLVAASAAEEPNAVEIGETAALIARKAQDLSDMVRRLRRFGDRAADAPSSIPVQQLLADLAAIAAPEAKAAGVSIDFASGEEVTVLGQDIELRQALLNLVRNALGASARGGRVSIAHQAADGRVRFVVENAVRAVEERRPGMGVGLIIARSIAEAHNGRIEVERPAPDRMRFTLDLPTLGAESA